MSGGEGDLTPMAMLSESQHMMLSSQMIDAKQARAKAEAERQMRLNRIARLQNEEMKLMKRIEETHKRTKDILAQKAARERAAIEKQNLEMMRNQERNSQRIELLDRKTKQRANIRSSQEAAWVNRHHMVQSVKQKKEWIQEESHYRRQSDLQQRRELRDDIRRQHDVRRERKKLASEMMDQHLRLEQEARRAAEEEKIRAQEARLAELERKEMRLLQSLQSYQGEQAQALQEVEMYLGPRRSRTVSPRAPSDAGSRGRRGPMPDSAPDSGEQGAGGPGVSFPRASPPHEPAEQSPRFDPKGEVHTDHGVDGARVAETRTGEGAAELDAEAGADADAGAGSDGGRAHVAPAPAALVAPSQPEASMSDPAVGPPASGGADASGLDDVDDADAPAGDA